MGLVQIWVSRERCYSAPVCSGCVCFPTPDWCWVVHGGGAYPAEVNLKGSEGVQLEEWEGGGSVCAREAAGKIRAVWALQYAVMQRGCFCGSHPVRPFIREVVPPVREQHEPVGSHGVSCLLRIMLQQAQMASYLIWRKSNTLIQYSFLTPESSCAALWVTISHLNFWLVIGGRNLWLYYKFSVRIFITSGRNASSVIIF